MIVNNALTEILNRAGANKIIGELNNGEELSREKLLLIFNALAEEINK